MIALVQVTYRRAKQGQRESWVFEDYSINRPYPDDWPEDIPGYDWNGAPIPTAHIHDERLGGVYLDLPTDWFGLRFDFTGQFFDSQQNPLEWEYEASSGEDTFGDWADDLKAIGDKLIDEEATKRQGGFDPDSPPSQVTFLTAWDFRCGRDYEGESFAEWDLLGLIDLSRIKELIMKEVKANG